MLLATHDGDVMWHERTRVDMATDGENWETAHHAISLDEHEDDEVKEEEGDDDEEADDRHPEL